MRYLVFFLIVSSPMMSVSAQVYKWVDEHGKTQYTDQPPPSVATKEKHELKIKSAPPSLSSSSPSIDQSDDVVSEREAFNKRREEKLEAKNKKLAQLEENKQQCNDAKGRLRVYRDTPRLTMPDGNGGIVYVDDDKRQAEINKSKEAIAKYCD